MIDRIWVVERETAAGSLVIATPTAYPRNEYPQATVREFVPAAALAAAQAQVADLRSGLERIREMALRAEGMTSVQYMAIEFGFINAEARALLGRQQPGGE